jgi:hypothetical protein
MPALKKNVRKVIIQALENFLKIFFYLVADKSGKVVGETGIILGEGSDAAAVVLGSLLRQVL